MWRELEELEEALEKLKDRDKAKVVMSGKAVLVIFHKCRPGDCDKGICPAVAACPHKLVKQEAPYEIPMFYPTICQGCGDYV